MKCRKNFEGFCGGIGKVLICVGISCSIVLRGVFPRVHFRNVVGPHSLLEPAAPTPPSVTPDLTLWRGATFRTDRL